MRRSSALLAVSALLFPTAQASAQVTALRNLAFGTIVSGTTTSVSKTSVSAAQWSIAGTFLAGGTFQLTLPTTLTGPGTAIPITFSATDGLRNTANNPATGTTFNPSTTQTIPAAPLSTTIYVWLGGSVSPPLNQAPGNYSGNVVLTVTGML
ncbi:MAG TPA: DUF4402 domain-containing protein [Gemmatimonadales bacterium]|nr:DUF4402 domain-containing protein [Gemmatimonadales bacterium]